MASNSVQFRARLLLDVDGVINAVDLPGAKQFVVWPEECWHDVQVDGWPILFAEPVAEWIRGLPRDEIDVRWLTTWERKANQYLAPDLNLPQALVLRKPWAHVHEWWKFTAAQILHEEDPLPTVWLDDDLLVMDDARAWLADEGGLAFAPEPDIGLEPWHLELVNGFFESTGVHMPDLTVR